MTILSNGNRFCEPEYAKKAISAGLESYHISMHSHIHSIHDALVKKEGSLERCFKALQTLLSLGAHITINITINSYNVAYFDRLIATILRFFPDIDGFIINNLETSQIPKHYHSVIASLESIEKTIPRALSLIEASGKRVRIERVPMCYIRGFEHLSTDLEYTIGGEEKFLHYLGEFRESMELHRENYMNSQKYGKQCAKCDLK
jgi:molybdenum cofactor biosynthesis enzyme MoaA